jgi:hypothetical protein
LAINVDKRIFELAMCDDCAVGILHLDHPMPVYRDAFAAPLAVSAALASAAGSAAGFGVAASVAGAAFTVATFASVRVLVRADFDAVLCDCARLVPARAKIIAASMAKAKIPLPTRTMFPLLFLSLISLLLFSDLFRLPAGTPMRISHDWFGRTCSADPRFWGPRYARFQAPKGCPITAQANGLGLKDQVSCQALKGRANTCHNFFPDFRFIPSGGTEPWFL